MFWAGARLLRDDRIDVEGEELWSWEGLAGRLTAGPDLQADVDDQAGVEPHLREAGGGQIERDVRPGAGRERGARAAGVDVGGAAVAAGVELNVAGGEGGPA